MSSADRPPGERPQSTPTGRRRARVLIPVVVVAAVVLIFLFMWLVNVLGGGH